MNTYHLTVFLTVCEQMNMTQAGKILFMTQPSVSQVIAELERTYNVRLFERLNRRLYLTAAGERLQSYARHIINLEDQARKELASLSDAGLLRIGASHTIGAYLLPEITARYHERLPEVEIFTRVENTREIERLLFDDRIDFGIVEGLVHSPDLLEKTIMNDDLLIVCAPNHPLSGNTRISPQDLTKDRFIVREEGSGTRELFANQMHAAGVAWQAAGVYNSTEAIKHAVQKNLGLGVLPAIAVQQEIREGTVCVLPVQGLNLRRKFNLIYHRQKYFTRAMQAFENCLMEWRTH